MARMLSYVTAAALAAGALAACHATGPSGPMPGGTMGPMNDDRAVPSCAQTAPAHALAAPARAQASQPAPCVPAASR
jgi:hypothetical protein